MMWKDPFVPFNRLASGAGMPQAVEHDAGEFRVLVLPLDELLADEDRFYRQTVGQTQEHPAVAVAFRVNGFVHFQTL